MKFVKNVTELRLEITNCFFDLFSLPALLIWQQPAALEK